MKRASCVLITDTNGTSLKILGFKRLDSNNIGLPGGKVEHAESYQDAAVREVFEETGLVVEVDSSAPYIDYDYVSNMMVATFLARIVGGEMIDVRDGEGSAIYCSPADLVHGEFGEYNRLMLRHFGINIPFLGAFHAHFSITDAPSATVSTAAVAIGGKHTAIHLESSGRTQRDQMITVHYVTGRKGILDSNAVIADSESKAEQLTKMGLNVARIKVESEPWNQHSVSSDAERIHASAKYTEAHVKLKLTEDQLSALRLLMHADQTMDTWRLSTNIYARSSDGHIVQFINKRFSGDQHTLATIRIDVRGMAHRLMQLFPLALVEIKLESAIYDNNTMVDRWWAA